LEYSRIVQLKILQSGFISYKSHIKKIKIIIGIISFISGVICVFQMGKRVIVGGALIGLGVALVN
jgi:hypothetical protein